MRIWSGTVAALALLLVVLATVRGFDPGDATGAVQMRSARQLALVSMAVAVVAMLPLRRLVPVLAGLATLLLLVAVGFWLHLIPG